MKTLVKMLLQVILGFGAIYILSQVVPFLLPASAAGYAVFLAAVSLLVGRGILR